MTTAHTVTAKRTREQVDALIERNQVAYLEGLLQPDQFAYNMACLSAELDELDRGQE
jgi:hypothetical protein